MKRNFSKRFVAPLAVMILGGAGAFITTSMGSTKALVEKPGYRYLSDEDPCHEEIQCSTVDNNVICTSGGNQLYDMQNPNTCDLPLFKIDN